MSRASIGAMVLATLALPGLVLAQSSGPSQQETILLLIQQVRELQQQDRDLQERIKVLESTQKNFPKPETAPAPVATTDPSESSPAEQPVSAQAETRGVHDMRGMQWRGFGEVDYMVLDQRTPELGTYGFVPGSAGNFYSGDFGLFLTARLTDKTSVLSEILFEERDAQRYKVDLRRMLLKYDWNDHVKMSFGRYQTNIGYYNWAFRSAAWLQTTANRPLVMEYASNGGLLPTQAIGVSITGAISSGKLGLNYVVEYGSSDTIRPDVNGDGRETDENNGNQVNAGFYLRPDTVPGLQIGASYYHDKISNFDQEPSLRYGQTIINSYVVYAARGIEFLNEGFLIRDAALHFNNAVFNTPAFYSQFSKKFGHIRPFFRYQYVNASDNLLYDDVGLRFGPSFGARYDLNDYMAFKAQLDHTARHGEPNLNGLQLQLAFTF
ncbi:MAG TPA: hypothetical protein VI386_32035 [Candidatus Sulfotelmatobacter sp.]